MKYTLILLWTFIVEITCSTPPLVNNTVIDAIELSISGVAHYRCLNGYLKTGGNDSMHCNIFGQWEGYLMQCEGYLNIFMSPIIGLCTKYIM